MTSSGDWAGLPRILYLALEAPREGRAGYAHVHEIVAGLRRVGHTVELFVPRYEENAYRPGLAARLSQYGRLQWRLARAARAGDVIYVRAHFLAIGASLYGRLAGLRVIQEVNGPYEDLFITYPWTRVLRGPLVWVQRVQFALADALIAVTPQLSEWLLRQIPNANVAVIPNGANTELFTPEASPPRASLPAKFVVFFGGLALWHGVDTMLAALSTRSWPQDTDLVVVGDGQLGPMVSRAAESNPRLHWLGRVKYAEVPGIVSRALAGLVAVANVSGRGKTGMFPIKLFETLACGVPAIVTDFPGQADLVREGQCGIVIPDGNPEALAQAVADLAANPVEARAMGRRGAELVRREHSWQRRAEQTAAVIARVAQERA